MHPKHIRIENFNYPLPDERIAKYPLPERDSSKLLIYNHGQISHDTFLHLPEHLSSGALMVMNNTRVIRARIHFQKESGARIEVFCMEPFAPAEYQQNFITTGSVEWLCMIGNLKRWKSGVLTKQISVGGKTVTLTAERFESQGDSGTNHRVRFSWDSPATTFAEVLEAIGELPIPPYLNRATEESDLKTYQTVYSKVKGSVAAPTAGLHFTDRVLQAIDQAGIQRTEVTLHVGAGTFKPVKSEEIADHEMHSEYIVVPRATIAALIQHGGHAIAVGTTSVRTLESLYYIGRKLQQNPHLSEEELHVNQWEPYEGMGDEVSPADICNAGNGEAAAEVTGNGKVASEVSGNGEAASEVTGNGEVAAEVTGNGEAASEQDSNLLPYLTNILRYLDDNHLPALHTTTQIIIAPGYRYHIVNKIITNFHQPQSTLLLLVSAFVGDDWRKIYDYALTHDFRFLSYGDSSLLIP